MRPVIATVLLLAFALPAGADDLTGKTVRVKEDGLKLGRRVDKGLIRDGEATSAKKTYRVKSDDDYFIELDGGYVFKFEVEAVAEEKVDAKSWVGKSVVPKRDGVKSGKKNGDVIEYGGDPLLPVSSYFVNAERDPMIQVGHCGEWSLKKDFVLLDEAHKYYMAKIEAEPKNAEWHFLLGSMYLKQAGGLPSHALANLDNVKHKITLDQSLASMRNACELDPKYREQLAWLLIQRRESEEAVKAVTAILRDDKNIAPERTGKLITCRATALNWLGRTNEALADHALAIKINPEASEPFWNRATLYMANGKYEEAIRDFTVSIERAKDVKGFGPREAFVRRSKCYVRLENYKLAMEDADTLVKRFSYDEDGYLQKAKIFYLLGKHDDAIGVYRDYLRLCPSKTQYLTFVGFMLRKKKNYLGAIQEFEAALKGDPLPSGAISSLADLLATCPDAEFRDGKRAVELAKKAIELASVTVDWSDVSTLAAAYAEAGDFERAVAEQRKAIEKLKAEKKPDADTLKKAEARLALYRAKKPYRDE